MSHVISDRCQKFLDHWESLRNGGLMPSLQDFLAVPNPDLQPYVMITDLVSETEIPIRLFGTYLVDLGRTEQTKRDFMQAFAPEHATVVMDEGV